MLPACQHLPGGGSAAGGREQALVKSPQVINTVPQSCRTGKYNVENPRVQGGMPIFFAGVGLNIRGEFRRFEVEHLMPFLVIRRIVRSRTTPFFFLGCSPPDVFPEELS